MTEQYSSVVIFDADPTSATHAASLLNFLDIPTAFASDEDGLRMQMGELPKLVAIFVAADDHYELLAASLRAIEDMGRKCACFVIERNGVDAPVPAALSARIQGVMSDHVRYKEVLGAINEAELYNASAGKSPGDSSARLLRGLVGCSRDITYIRQLIGQVAHTDASVLITGESGTGKEVVARTLHDVSGRCNKPFVPINCGAIPLELLESELFGHEKGAFTGAISSRQGRFELAEGGTLFLDEIGDMPMSMQVKLLRVLQERSFERVGGNRTVHTDVRIVAATHRNLEQLVKDGGFRMDLLYRLNVFPIEVSPLRDRVEDISPLINYFSNKLAQNGRCFSRLSESALACLSKYHWPGNVREVFNLLERLAILYPGKVVEWSDLPPKFCPNHDWLAESIEELVEHTNVGVVPPATGSLLPTGGIDLKPHLADIEYCLMEQALEQSNWVVARAAKLLKLQRTTMVEKMRKFDLARPKELTIN